MNLTFVGITVVGNVVSEHTIEDIRITVPHRVAVQIPASMIQRSKDLVTALSENKVIKLSGSIPSGSTWRSGVAAPHRSHAAANNDIVRAELRKDLEESRQSHLDSKCELEELKVKYEGLQKELATAKQREVVLQTNNQGLQTTLSLMSTQLSTIQLVLEELKAKGITVSSFPGAVLPGRTFSDDVPMFIPDTFKRDDIEVNIKVKEVESATDISASRSALKSLRKNKEQS